MHTAVRQSLKSDVTYLVVVTMIRTGFPAAAASKPLAYEALDGDDQGEGGGVERQRGQQGGNVGGGLHICDIGIRVSGLFSQRACVVSTWRLNGTTQ